MSSEMFQAWRSLHQMAASFYARLPHLILALIVFGLFYLVGRVIRSVVTRLSHRKSRHAYLSMVLGRVVHGLILIMGLLIAMVIALPSFQPAQLVQLLGISSVAVGFAFREILQNFLAGLLLLLTQPFRIEDQIRFGEYEGIVEDIQARATMIRTYDGRRIVIPNAELFTKSVTVNTAYENRRLQEDVGIGYGDDMGRAKELMLQAMQGVEEVLDDPAPEVLLVSLGSSTVDLRARWWIHPPRRSEETVSRSKVLEAIKKTLVENGIDLPFETRTILFHDQTDENDGERARQREGWPAGNGEVPRPRSIAGALLARGERQGKAEGEPAPRPPGSDPPAR
jgi:small conductance mechanosensitive channel